MTSGYILTIQKLSVILASFIVLSISTVDSVKSNSIQVSQKALDDRAKRNAELQLPSDDEDLKTSKRYIPYEELQKRLRHFIGKRGDGDDEVDLDNLGPDPEKRMRYFVGKRSEEAQTIDPNDEVAKRMRYFVGKKSRVRYFVGKRDEDDNDLEKRMRYFVGKRRYFLGKRRYFIGKRDDLDENEDPFQKRSRVRYFVGKRSTDDFTNSNAFQKRMRYFVGKRDSADEENDEFVDKRMRYFVGKRDIDTPLNNNNADYEKRKNSMRYFVG